MERRLISVNLRKIIINGIKTVMFVDVPYRIPSSFDQVMGF